MGEKPRDYHDFIKERWWERDTVTVIAEKLGGKLTPNQIIGYIHRQGFEKRPKPEAPPRKIVEKVRAAKTLPAPPAAAPPPATPPGPESNAVPDQAPAEAPPAAAGIDALRVDGFAALPISMLKDGMCKFPKTLDGRHYFCGQKAPPGQSWFRAHRGIVYVATPVTATRRTA